MIQKLLALRNSPHLAFIACATGQLLWGVSYMFTRVAQQSAEPIVQLSIRFIISFLMMCIPVLLKPSRLTFKTGHILKLLAYGLGLPVYHFLESNGVYYTNSSFAAVVLALYPLMALGLAAIFLKEYPTRHQVIFSFLPFLGVIFITLANSQMGAITTIGVVLLLLCCVSGATGRIINRFCASMFTTFERTFSTLFVGAVTFTVAAFLTVEDVPAAYAYALSQPSFVASTLALCILCSIVADLLVNYSFAVLPVVKISSISALSTTCSLVVGVVFLHEPFNAMSILGAALTLIGIWQVNKAPKKVPAETVSAPDNNN